MNKRIINIEKVLLTIVFILNNVRGNVFQNIGDFFKEVDLGVVIKENTGKVFLGIALAATAVASHQQNKINALYVTQKAKSKSSNPSNLKGVLHYAKNISIKNISILGSFLKNFIFDLISFRLIALSDPKKTINNMLPQLAMEQRYSMEEGERSYDKAQLVVGEYSAEESLGG